MSMIKIVEHDGIRVLTTQQLAESYGTTPDIINKNFNNNRGRYIEGKHFICLEGEELRREKAKGNIYGLQQNANKFYLWTEKGAFLHAKSLNSDTAWDVYDRLVDFYFMKKSDIDRTQLSPQMQLIYSMVEQQAQIELEQKRLAEQTAKIEQKVETMQNIMTEPIGDWREEINNRVREVAISCNIPYQSLYDRMYAELETTAHCSLKRLQENKIERMKRAGNTKTAIKNGTTKIAIIEDKPQLKAIFENIVRRYAMAHC